MRQSLRLPSGQQWGPPTKHRKSQAALWPEVLPGSVPKATCWAAHPPEEAHGLKLAGCAVTLYPAGKIEAPGGAWDLGTLGFGKAKGERAPENVTVPGGAACVPSGLQLCVCMCVCTCGVCTYVCTRVEWGALNSLTSGSDQPLQGSC